MTAERCTASTCGHRRNSSPAISPASGRRRAGSSCRRPMFSRRFAARGFCWSDDDGVRADMTASWLAQMGWEVYVLDDGLKVSRSSSKPGIAERASAAAAPRAKAYKRPYEGTDNPAFRHAGLSRLGVRPRRAARARRHARISRGLNLVGTLTQMAHRLELSPTGAALGAELSGIDLRSIDDSDFTAIYRAWLDHQVLLVRDQHLTDGDLIAFSRRFGDLDRRRCRRTAGDRSKATRRSTSSRTWSRTGVAIGSLGSGEAVWHTDMSLPGRSAQGQRCSTRSRCRRRGGDTGSAR